MNNKMIKKILKIALVCCVLILSFYLRYQNYDSVPLKGQSWDEYSYSWTGLSLIRLGVPVGISGIDGYKMNDLRYINIDHVFQNTAEGNPIVFNEPWFDHPPLLGLITGGFSYLRGARVFEDTGTFLIRKPMIVLGTVSVLLVFLIGFLNFDYWVGIISALIYGTMPLVVISSRMVQGENGLIPFMLASFLFLSLFLKKKKIVLLFLSAMFAGLASLCKLSGLVSVLIAVISLFLFEKNKTDFVKKSVFFVLIAVSLTSLFVIYGAVLDWETFVNIFKSNSNRFYGIGTAAIYNLFVHVKVTHSKTMADAWPLASWIAFLVLCCKKISTKPEKLLVIGVLSYLIFYIFLGSYSYGWYALPFWPILCLILGRLISMGFRKKEYLLAGFILLFLPFGLLLEKVVNVVDFQKYSGFWRYGLGFLLVLMLLGRYHKEKGLGLFSGLSKFFLFVLFLLTIYLNVRFVGMINIDSWYGLS